jgi:hypothetical protein
LAAVLAIVETLPLNLIIKEMVLSSEAQKVGDVTLQYTPASLAHLVQVVINFILAGATL